MTTSLRRDPAVASVLALLITAIAVPGYGPALSYVLAEHLPPTDGRLVLALATSGLFVFLGAKRADAVRRHRARGRAMFPSPAQRGLPRRRCPQGHEVEPTPFLEMRLIRIPTQPEQLAAAKPSDVAYLLTWFCDGTGEADSEHMVTEQINGNIAVAVTRAHSSAGFGAGHLLVDLVTQREARDAQRFSPHPLTADDLSAALDQIWLDSGFHLVERPELEDVRAEVLGGSQP